MSRSFSFFYISFKNCDILTIDGHGEQDTCFLGTGKNNDIKEIKTIKYPHSAGLFYGTFTDFLVLKLTLMSGKLWLYHHMQEKEYL